MKKELRRTKECRLNFKQFEEYHSKPKFPFFIFSQYTEHAFFQYTHNINYLITSVFNSWFEMKEMPLQVNGGGDGQVRDAPSCITARVEVHQGFDLALAHRQRATTRMHSDLT